MGSIEIKVGDRVLEIFFFENYELRGLWDEENFWGYPRPLIQKETLPFGRAFFGMIGRQ